MLAGMLSVVAVCCSAPLFAFDFNAVADRSFYTSEKAGRLLLIASHDSLTRAGLTAEVLAGESVIGARQHIARDRRVTAGFSLAALPQRQSRVTCRLLLDGAEIARAAALVIRLPPRPNAVKIDRISGGLLVDDLPFIPVGFFSHWPLQPSLAENEVVRGFNLISPYQPNDIATVAQRRAYMDRCAALGMKVNYHLQNAAAALLKGNEKPLRSEIASFRDHPALLSWYLGDQQQLRDVSPDGLGRARDLVAELDPYHPVTAVSMRPGVRDYTNALDITMTNPHPIPHDPPAAVREAVAERVAAVGPEKPVWLVPQAFGGNEFWTREPTAPELRVMTYLGVLEGATGFQNFIRHGPNGFPKSPLLWSACSRAALEIMYLTPVRKRALS